MKLFPDLTHLHRAAIRAYTLLPYRFSRQGYALPAPFFIFEMTRRCNLRCQMCQYIQWLRETPPGQQKEGELTTEEWLGVIRQVPRWGLISFTGGEPFVRGDFLDLLGCASSRCRTHMITNGTMLTEERVRHLMDFTPRRFGGVGFNILGLSLEGPEEVNDRIRGEGGFAKTINAIKMVSSMRRERGRRCPVIHVTTVIQKGNLDYLSWMPQIVADAGGDVVNFTLEVRNQELQGFGSRDPSGYSMPQLNSPRLDPQRVSDALRDTRRAAEQAGVELRTPNMPDREIVRYYAGQTDLRDFQCPELWSTLIVSSKGDVHPCWVTRVGNVRETSLKSAWNNEKFRAFRRRAREGLFTPCAGCCMLLYHAGNKSE
ncbi:MAG: radical SAM protein [Candidatus Hydrogenedentes bacterium]|nr:radical SAM protein [Candidatus Hydrogenedentota bacterium]